MKEQEVRTTSIRGLTYQYEDLIDNTTGYTKLKKNMIERRLKKIREITREIDIIETNK